MTYRLRLARNGLKLKVATRIPAQLVGGTGMTVTRANGTYTIDMNVDEVVDVLEPTVLDRANHTGTQLASTISDFSEATDDRLNSLLVAGANISLTYSDVGNTLTVANTGVNTIAGNVGAFTLGHGLTNSTNEIKIDVGVMRGYLSGLALSTAGSSATFGIAAGVAVDSTAADFMKLTSAYTKTTSAWAVGTGNGALDTGTVANSTWYHVFLIKRPDTGVVDVLFSLSATAPTMPDAAYTLMRRIGSMKTNGSAQWTLFTQEGDEFLWDVPLADVNSTPAAATAVTSTLTVPTGVKVFAIIGAGGAAGAGSDGRFYISSLDQSDQPAGAANFSAGWSGGTTGQQGWSAARIRTNTSAQIRWRPASTTGSYFINTKGWIDDRGRNA
jgi:hypothetical protein